MGKKKDDLYGDSTIFKKRCAVTAFDMTLRVTTDGRKRGLWLWLDDEDDGHRKRIMNLLDATAKKWFEEQKKTPTPEELWAFTGVMRLYMDNFLKWKVHEAAQLEWPAVKKLHEALGKALKQHEKEADDE